MGRPKQPHTDRRNWSRVLLIASDSRGKTHPVGYPGVNHNTAAKYKWEAAGTPPLNVQWVVFRDPERGTLDKGWVSDSEAPWKS